MDRIHEVHIIERKTSNRIHVIWEETDKNSSNCQTWERVAWGLVPFGKKPPRIEKNKNGQKRSQNSIKARRLIGIYFIDPDDEEYKETLKNARRKLERPWHPACLVKELQIASRKCKSEIASEKIPKTVHDCIVEAHESTRQRFQSSQVKNHEDHIAGKGFTSLTHYNLTHKFIPMPQAMKIPDAKAAKRFQRGKCWKSRVRRRLSWKHKETERKSTLPHWWTYATLTTRSWNPSYESIKSFTCPTELRLIGCSKGSIWNPRSKSNVLTPETNSLTC